MKKLATIFLMCVTSLAAIGVFHYYMLPMYEWTRPLVLIPLVYAGLNYRRAGSIAAVTLLIAAQSPLILLTYHRDPASGMNYVVAGTALSLLGVYLGHILRKERELRQVWNQAEQVRNRVCKSASIQEMLSLLQDLFAERGSSDAIEIYMLDEQGLLRKYDDPDESPLPGDHLYYDVVKADDFIVSTSVEDDDRIILPETGGKGINRLAVFPIHFGGAIRGVISIINMRDENFDRDMVINLTSIKQPVERSLTLLERRRTTIQHKLEHEKIRDTFSSYVSRSIAEEILKDPDKLDLGGRQQKVTVMFIEVLNFAEHQETCEPAEIFAMLNQYFSIALDTIFEFDGTLDKFIGDNSMAFWGAPIEMHDGNLRAVKCAATLKQRMESLNAQWEKQGRKPFDIRIGINSGNVVAGNIGSIRRMEYTVIGDTVNTAARIKTAAGQFNVSILLNKCVYQDVREHFTFSDSMTIAVKGKEKPLEVYALDA